MWFCLNCCHPILPLPLVQLVLPHLLPKSLLPPEPAQPRLSLPPLLSLAPPGLGDLLLKAEGFLLGTALGTLQVSFICGWETIGGTGTSLTFLDAIRSSSTLEAAIVVVVARDERVVCGFVSTIANPLPPSAQPRLSLPPLLSLYHLGGGDPLPKAEGFLLRLCFLLGSALCTLHVSFIYYQGH